MCAFVLFSNLFLIDANQYQSKYKYTSLIPAFPFTVPLYLELKRLYKMNVIRLRYIRYRLLLTFVLSRNLSKN